MATQMEARPQDEAQQRVSRSISSQVLVDHIAPRTGLRPEEIIKVLQALKGVQHG